MDSLTAGIHPQPLNIPSMGPSVRPGSPGAQNGALVATAGAGSHGTEAPKKAEDGNETWGWNP